MRGIRQWISLGLLGLLPFMGEAQELNARITVNGEKVAVANKQIFTTLQNALTEFVNNRRWMRPLRSTRKSIATWLSS